MSMKTTAPWGSQVRIQWEMLKSSAPEGRQVEYLIGARTGQRQCCPHSPAGPWVPVSQGNLCLSFIWGNQSWESSSYSPKITHTIRRHGGRPSLRENYDFLCKTQLYYSLEWSIPESWVSAERTSSQTPLTVKESLISCLSDFCIGVPVHLRLKQRCWRTREKQLSSCMTEVCLPAGQRKGKNLGKMDGVYRHKSRAEAWVTGR